MAEMVSAGVEPHRAVLAMNATGLFLTALAQAMSGGDATDALAVMAADPAAFPVSLAALRDGHGLRGYEELLDLWLDLLVASVLPAERRPS